MSDLVKELQRELDHIKTLCKVKDDKISELKWFAAEHKSNLDRIAKFNNITLSFNKLITLNSPVLTPELRALASTMYLNVDNLIQVNPAEWKRTNSHTGHIAAALGGFGAVEKVYQLPSRAGKGHQANIVFTNPEARKAGFEAVKFRYRKRAPAMKFSLQQFPKLRKQDQCLQLIFRELKQEGKIISYSLNNFAATRHNEFVFPLYTFRVSGNKVTKYEDSACIGDYRAGFTVPVDDVNFESPEFEHLKSLICEHVQECQNELDMACKKRAPALPTLADHVKPVMESRNISTEPSNFRECAEDPSGQMKDDTTSDMSSQQDEQWPKLGQNPISVSDSNKGSSHLTEQAIQSSAVTLKKGNQQESELITNNTPPRSISNAIKEKNFVFSPACFGLVGQPIAKGPLNESVIGSPPISSEFHELTPINPNLNISGDSF